MRKLLYKIKQLTECIVFNFHRNMFGVKHNTVFIIIYIRRILESPSAAIDRHRYYSMILPCRMVNTTRISFILNTEQAFRITALFRALRCGNRLGIFLRFRQINRNIQITVFRRSNPFLVFLDTIPSDIVRILTEFIEIIGGIFGIAFIFGFKYGNHFTRSGYQHTHNLRIKQIPVHDAVLSHNPMFVCIIHHF